MMNGGRDTTTTTTGPVRPGSMSPYTHQTRTYPPSEASDEFLDMDLGDMSGSVSLYRKDSLRWGMFWRTRAVPDGETAPPSLASGLLLRPPPAWPPPPPACPPFSTSKLSRQKEKEREKKKGGPIKEWH